MKEFLPIKREEAIKKIAEYFRTTNSETVGIVFEKQRDATAFLDEVKKNLDKGRVWNKKSIESNTNTRVVTDNCRNPIRILSGWSCSKLFIEQKCFEKHSEDFYKTCICPQCALNPDNVENYLIID
jgi:hypothetical protein